MARSSKKKDDQFIKVEFAGKQTRIQEIMEKAVFIASVKYKDRGPENIAQYGVNGVILRLADKMARFKKTVYDRWDSKLPMGGISERSINKVVIDAYDMINYAAFMIMLIEGTWGAPNAIPDINVEEIPEGEDEA